MRALFVIYVSGIMVGIAYFTAIGLAHSGQQSEFLAVGSFAVLAVYLRQRGSPESKPVGAPHSATGLEG